MGIHPASHPSIFRSAATLARLQPLDPSQDPSEVPSQDHLQDPSTDINQPTHLSCLSKRNFLLTVAGVTLFLVESLPHSTLPMTNQLPT
jgi:hypothetical protein